MNSNSSSKAELWEASFARRPASRKLRDLVVAAATEEGGLVLKVWQALEPQYWGLGDPLTSDQVAKTLNLPVSTVHEIADRIRSKVRPLWIASPEHAEWLKSRKRRPGGSPPAPNS